MSEIVIPQINNNDTHAVLVEWCVEDGSLVSAGDVIAVLETSKSTFDLESTEAGPLKIEGDAGEEYAFGDRIGYVGDESSTPKKESATGPVSEEADARVADATEGLILTQGARAAVASRGIDISQLKRLGKRVIRERDVEKLVASTDTDEAASDDAGSAQQSAISKVVTRSHREIPTAFLLKKIVCDRALEWLQECGELAGKMISLPDLFVSEIGRMQTEFPLFFSNSDPRGGLKKGLSANIGVTFDFGKGLFVPVIPEVDALSIEGVAKTMMRYRMKAMRGRFAESDLSGGALSVSLNTEPDTILVRPLILPPQICMISLGAILSELYLDAEGVPRERRFVNVGVAYDHRFINGFESQAFASALKERIESVGGDG